MARLERHIVCEAVGMVEVEAVLRHVLLFVILPLWITAGLLDWHCHRRSDIEHTSGVKESTLHFVELAEAAVPLIFSLFFRANALVLSLIIAAVVLHTATAYWDVAYADARRKITPTEQHCHAVLEMLPFTIAVLVSAFHWRQLASIVGLVEPADFGLHLSTDPISPLGMVAIIASTGVLLILPYVEEMWRCMRAQSTNRHAKRTDAAYPVPTTSG